MSILKKINSVLTEFSQINTWILKGSSGSFKESMEIVFIGNEKQKNYIAQIVFNSECEYQFLGKHSLWSLYFFLKKSKNKFDMVFIEGHIFHKVFFKRRKDFFVPMWLTSTVNLPLKATSRSAKEDMRRIRKNNLSYEVANSIEKCHHFYYSMYLPTVQSRHEERTIPMNYGSMIDKINNHEGILLMIKMENKDIAGIVILMQDDTPRLWSSGILHGDTSYWKYGAIAATYFFSSDYLTKKGYTRMNMGLSRAFISDGVLQYKKKLGSKFANQGRRGFIIRTNTLSEHVQYFFINNPFAQLDKKELKGAIFTHEHKLSTDQIKRYDSEWNLSSFAECSIFRINNSEPYFNKTYNL